MKSGNLQKKHIILVKMGKIMPIRPDADPDRPDPDRHALDADPDPDPAK